MFVSTQINGNVQIRSFQVTKRYALMPKVDLWRVSPSCVERFVEIRVVIVQRTILVPNPKKTSPATPLPKVHHKQLLYHDQEMEASHSGSNDARKEA